MGLAFCFTVLMWWLSTGLLIILCARPAHSFGRSMAGGSLVLAGALYGLAASAWNESESAVYIAFLCAIGVWGWIEMSFLMGYVTGPRRAPCPPGIAGWPRFKLALATLLYHELAILAAAALILALTWGAPNQTGTGAFLILMAMRVSAKLNIFLGVPNLTDAFLPARLGYLKSYFRKRSFNLLFPVSIIGGTLVAVALAQSAVAAGGTTAVGSALLLTLLSLALLEHLFMILPLPDAALWHWAMPLNPAKPIEKPLP